MDINKLAAIEQMKKEHEEISNKIKKKHNWTRDQQGIKILLQIRSQLRESISDAKANYNLDRDYDKDIQTYEWIKGIEQKQSTMKIILIALAIAILWRVI